MAKHVTIVAGARPNFIKISPIISEINKQKSLGETIDYSLIHTGQHYDDKMSGSFFEQLKIPKPDINLNAKGSSQAEQTASIMINFEKYLLINKTDIVLVVGDVNSTMACAITAQKLKIKVAHVEGGIRSDDWTMPEEINRLVTDSISNYFFTTSIHANNNLLKSGVAKNRIFFVGNTMIDTLLKNINRLKKPNFWNTHKLKSKNYFVLTLHRPSNVDEENKLKEFLNVLIRYSSTYKIVFPVHPRTRKTIKKIGISHEKLILTEPLSYLEFNFLVKNSFAVFTDSGGITEETTVFGIPCFTLRDNTERPETILIGTNQLVGIDPKKIKFYLNDLLNGKIKKGSIPKLWDGKAAKRIVKKLISL